MSPWIYTEPSKKLARVVLHLQFGTTTKVATLPTWQVDSYAKIHIVAALRRYINHRRRIITKHGGTNTAETRAALSALDYAFSGPTTRWAFAKMPRIIKAYESQLYAIAPSPRSKYFRCHTQLLTDLLGWADYELKKERSHGR